MKQIFTALRNIIRKAITSSPQKDGNKNYITQVRSYNAPLQTEVIYPYGSAGSPPVGSSALVFMVANQPENLSAISYAPTTRFKGLAPGEYIVGNQQTQTFIKFLASGDIEIFTKGNVALTGNMTITGNLAVQGEITALDATDPLTFSDIRSIYNSHDHNDPQGGVTGAPNQPL